jgi:putative ABC transport system substrate-binding protein
MGVGNPVGIGIVESLSHPGGNVTGFADLTVDLSGKLLEFAREFTPAGKPIGYLWYDKWLDGQNRLLAIEQAAKASGVTLQARAISDVIELDSVVADFKSDGIKAVIVQPSVFTWRHRQQIIEVMKRSTLAMICVWPPIVAEGALIGYGNDYPDHYRRAGSYVSRVLKGEKPAELPVQNPTKFRLVINLNAAKVLGLQIPATLLATADEVIE